MADEAKDLRAATSAVEVLIPDLEVRFGPEVNDELVLAWTLRKAFYRLDIGTESGLFLSGAVTVSAGTETADVGLIPDLRLAAGWWYIGAMLEGGPLFGTKSGWGGFIGAGPMVSWWDDVAEFTELGTWSVAAIYRHGWAASAAWHGLTIDVSVAW